MSYLLDRLLEKKERKQQSFIELIQSTTKSRMAFSRLDALIQYKREQKDSDDRAHRAMQTVIEVVETQRIPDDEASPAFSFLEKTLALVGRSIVRYVIRPIMSFGVRVAMS